ncbi:integrase [Kitasatospora sp. NPDC089509]|uniref:integrase n=1 Tax=Kitasatospora sp. NPDC089509 TaxID=3364079 RepID=UPI003802AD39
MNTPAPDLDRAVLPGPDTPVVLPAFLGTLHAGANARYADPVWPLSPLSDNPSARRLAVYWDRCPPGLRDELRLAAWTMINGSARPSFLKTSGAAARARWSASHLNGAVTDWIRFALWLRDHGIHTLAACDRAVLDAYGTHVRDAAPSRGRVQKILSALTRLWLFDQASARPAGIARPPWEERGLDDYLPAARAARGENGTEPIAEQTMAPLLDWALLVVEDFADDILAANAERDLLQARTRTTTGSTGTREKALHDYLAPLLAARSPLPTNVRKGTVRLSTTYLQAVTGATPEQIRAYADEHGLARLAAERPGPCPLPTEVTGRIDGRPWQTAIGFHEAPVLRRHLGTACFIVIAYLTGMRPGEVLGLRSGCCPDPDPGGPAGRHLIRGHEFKNATDPDGNHLSAGAERDVPWVAIAPVVRAVRVLERMVPEHALLFDRHGHHPGAGPAETGTIKLGAMAIRIDGFITWANAEQTRHRLDRAHIPPDPHGRITSARLRRTLAWHIARRPGGLVALAVQYGHLRTLVSEGYASRSRGGIHDLLDVETARAVADTAARLHDDLAAGIGISGPAARHAVTTAATVPRFEGTTLTTIAARRLLALPHATLYDNPHALVLCHYKPAQALCHRDHPGQAPRLDHCRPACANIARTDRHATQLRQRAEALDRQADHVPGPVAERLRANAQRLNAQADHHDRTRTRTTHQDLQ